MTFIAPAGTGASNNTSAEPFANRIAKSFPNRSRERSAAEVAERVVLIVKFPAVVLLA